MTMLLIDEFLRKMSTTAASVLAKAHDPLVSSGITALLQGVRASDKIYFSESTMKMLSEKLDHFDEVCEEIMARFPDARDQIGEITERALSHAGIWIEFSKPIAFPVPIVAMFCFVPSRYLETGRDKNHLYLISQDAEVYSLITCVPDHAWEYEKAYHRCPTQQCAEEYGVQVLCEACRAILIGWSSIFTLAAIIAGQYLAVTRYEEREFTSARRVPRQHSGKTKAIVTKRVFKVIDANEILIEIPMLTPVEPRGSWLIDAIAEGDVEYMEKRTRPFERQYRHPRYINMQGKSTSFPEGIVRRQPVRKSLEGQRVTKVVASEYEEAKDG